MNVPDTWYDALTLGERMHLPPGPHNAAQGQQRMQRWRARPVFSGNDLFAQRLATAGMTEEDLARLLGQSCSDTRELAGPPPPWMQDLAQGLACPSSLDAAAEPDLALLLAWIGPLVTKELTRLGEAASALGFPRAATLNLLLPVLLQSLMPKVQRTLVLEWHVWREQAGTDVSLADFEQVLKQPLKQQALFEEYPVLARQVVQQTRFWREASAEFLERLHADRSALSQLVAAGQDLGHLTAVAASSGDAHGQGRRVMLLSFASGARLVYKPRSLAIDRHLRELIEYLLLHGLEPKLKTPVVLDQGSHGWVQWVDQETCSTVEDVDLFYQRLGCWLALMYALGATDLHAENLIAQGSQPLLVDVETLFQPRLDSSRNDTADAVTRKLLDDSIWSTGLLPDPALEDALDVSGLGASTAQLAPVAVPVVSTEAGNLRVDRMQPVLDSFKNRAVLNGVATVPSDWAEAVESGFSRTYRLLQSIGTQLPLQPFHQDPIRVLVRSTVRYGLTLMESWHPNLLRHGLAREQYFDHLWSDVQDHPWLARCIGSELAQMLNADIPHFTSTPLSLDIHGADGTHIAHLTVETGMQVAQGRIHRMGTDDLEFQLLLLRKSLYARQLPHSEAGDTAASAPDPLVLARQVGDALVSTALRCDGTSTWVTAEAGTFEPAGTGLYDGLPGIILFLAYLDTIVPDSKAPYRLLAEEALVQLQQLPAPTAPGAFTGLSGHIYLWIHLATLWSRPDLLQRAADAVPSLHVGDAPLDVIDGSAGIIACLLALHHVEPASGGLARATALGEHALQQAVACETGLKWPTLPRQRGFSHGSSGLAWSLARLGKVTHDQRFLEAAEDAFRYEEALVEASGWFDAEERTDAGSWCHGPPGIALARLGAHQEAQSALAITTESAALRHPGLCHGELGNLETLIVASPARENRVQALLRRTDLADTRRDPGLMTGLSGIGYGLLRLHAPHRVPSVLSLESPAH